MFAAATNSGGTDTAAAAIGYLVGLGVLIALMIGAHQKGRPALCWLGLLGMIFPLVGVCRLAKPGSAVRPYIVAGPGFYNRSVKITEYVGNGVICDPYWYVCGTYPVTDVVGSRGGWDFGFNVGGGVGFGLGDSAEFYIETRYHYVAGPEAAPVVNPLEGSSTKANGHYTPLTFGFRF